MKTRLSILPIVLLLLAARSVSAQSRDPFFTDFSVNYDAAYHESHDTSHAGAHVDIASTFKRDSPFIGPVGEVGFNRFNGGTVVSAMGGLRIRANVYKRILPFAQVILGVYHCGVCGSNNLAVQRGGGVDFGRSDNKVRVRAQVDVRRVLDGVFGFNAVRFSVGIVLPLNK